MFRKSCVHANLCVQLQQQRQFQGNTEWVFVVGVNSGHSSQLTGRCQGCTPSSKGQAAVVIGLGAVSQVVCPAAVVKKLSDMGEKSGVMQDLHTLILYRFKFCLKIFKFNLNSYKRVHFAPFYIFSFFLYRRVQNAPFYISAVIGLKN